VANPAERALLDQSPIDARACVCRFKPVRAHFERASPRPFHRSRPAEERKPGWIEPNPGLPPSHPEGSIVRDVPVVSQLGGVGMFKNRKSRRPLVRAAGVLAGYAAASGKSSAFSGAGAAPPNAAPATDRTGGECPGCSGVGVSKPELLA